MSSSLPPAENSTPVRESSGRTLLLVFFTVFLDLVGFGILIPIQPFYAESLGASPALITLLGASFSLTQFIFAPFWGRLSDKVGRRPVMLMSIGITAIGYTIFGFSKSLTLLFASRMLAGLGSANIGTAQAIIADSTSPEKRAKGMGIIGAAFGLGFIFGPAIGGAFGQFSLTTPIFVAAGLCALNFVFTLFMLPETHRAGAVNQPLPRHQFFSWRQFQEYEQVPNVMRLFIIFLVFTGAFSLMEQVLGLFIEKNFTNPNDTALHSTMKHAAALTTYMLLVVGVTATIIQGGLIGRLVKKFGERKLLVFGILNVAVSFLVIPFAGMAGVFWPMLVIAFLMALGTGLVNPSLTSLLSRSVDQSQQGTTLGLGQSLSALGRIIGPSVAGVLFQWSGALPFWVGAAFLTVSAGIAFSLASARPAVRRAEL
jgi:DHA1 family tetracycline resistance protein-like MFS transporter